MKLAQMHRAREKTVTRRRGMARNGNMVSDISAGDAPAERLYGAHQGGARSSAPQQHALHRGGALAGGVVAANREAAASCFAQRRLWCMLARLAALSVGLAGGVCQHINVSVALGEHGEAGKTWYKCLSSAK
jgi:hypothetical protein